MEAFGDQFNVRIAIGDRIKSSQLRIQDLSDTSVTLNPEGVTLQTFYLTKLPDNPWKWHLNNHFLHILVGILTNIKFRLNEKNRLNLTLSW